MLKQNSKYYALLFGEGFLNSYSQIYFSNGKLLSASLIFVTLFDLGGGIGGLLAVLVTQLTALLFHFDHKNIREGTYSYNSVMVGVAIGIFYQFNLSLFILILISSILTFFITVWFFNRLAAKGLPFLSIPFLLVTWIIILGGKNFSALELHEKTTLSLSALFPDLFSVSSEIVAGFPFADIFHLYFRSLGAILFQYNDLAGMVIAIGILLNSRISFILSLYGFVLGFLFYRFMEADFSHLIYSYIGFNFILTAMALGGFFIVASRRSFFLLLFIIPLIALIISSTHGLFQFFGLPLYSLPFNIVVLMVLYALNQRMYPSKLHLVTFQHFSPEKNHYKYFNSVERFSSQTYYSISLPIIGYWRIAQGHNGSITHRDEFRYALDFDVVNENNLTYQGEGGELKNYLCYNLPIIAPASGWVVAVVDGIEDNDIKDVNIAQNWGNTIVIKHGEYLFSKLSHLKNGSIVIKQGEYVYKGQIIGHCGSSGRSPEPHLHFQLQSTPFIGSKTIFFPVDYYLRKQQGKLVFHSFDVPKEHDEVCNIIPTSLLTKAFNFIPGLKLMVTASNEKNATWEIFVDSANRSYFFCHETKSMAYFVNNGTVFYFIDYYGKKDTLLHHFYKATHKVLLGYYPSVEVNDKLLPADVFSNPLNLLHDFTAPFFHYMHASYHFVFLSADSIHSPTNIEFETSTKGELLGKNILSHKYHINITNKEEIALTIHANKTDINVMICRSI
jgi:urea transporter/murein DD-endopeptidase MepM/ murein hydrolase activator NlpD